jgi:hypothetical protein
MALAIDRLIEINTGAEKTAADNSRSVFEALQYSQMLSRIGEDFLKTAAEIDSAEFETIGYDLIRTGERLMGGLSKMANDYYDVDVEYADIATDLYKLACYMDDLYTETGNEVMGEYTKVAAAISDTLAEEVGYDLVQKVWMEKEAASGLPNMAMSSVDTVVDPRMGGTVAHKNQVAANTIKNELKAAKENIANLENKMLTSHVGANTAKPSSILGRMGNKSLDAVWRKRGKASRAGILASAAAILGGAGFGVHRLSRNEA